MAVFLFHTRRVIEIVADSLGEAEVIVEKHLHHDDNETIDSVDEELTSSE